MISKKKSNSRVFKATALRLSCQYTKFFYQTKVKNGHSYISHQIKGKLNPLLDGYIAQKKTYFKKNVTLKQL